MFCSVVEAFCCSLSVWACGTPTGWHRADLAFFLALIALFVGRCPLFSGWPGSGISRVALWISSSVFFNSPPIVFLQTNLRVSMTAFHHTLFFPSFFSCLPLSFLDFRWSSCVVSVSGGRVAIARAGMERVEQGEECCTTAREASGRRKFDRTPSTSDGWVLRITVRHAKAVAWRTYF